jgi:hypothetical protein
MGRVASGASDRSPCCESEGSWRKQMADRLAVHWQLCSWPDAPRLAPDENLRGLGSHIRRGAAGNRYGLTTWMLSWRSLFPSLLSATAFPTSTLATVDRLLYQLAGCQVPETPMT